MKLYHPLKLNPVKSKPAGKSKVIFLAVTAIFVSGHAYSQTAANWNFNNTLNGTEGTNITASPAALSATTVGSFNAGSEYYGEGGWPAGAIDPTVYLQLSLSANTGNYLSLTSVTVTIRRSTTGTAAGSGPMAWSLRSSLDNYASDISTGSLTTSYVTTVVPLPAAYLSIPSSVSFRLYGYNMVVTAGGNNRFVFDNISAQGQAKSGVLAEHQIAFQAKAGQQHNAELQWKTTGFDAGTDLLVERSVDGSNFSTIYRETMTTADDAGDQYEDGSVPSASRIYYRITANQPDGLVYQSPIVSIQGNAGQGMQILGVTGQGTGTSVKAFLNIPGEGEYQLILRTSDGKSLSRRMISGGAGRMTTDIDFGAYPHGIYILTLLKGDQATSKQFFN